MLGVTISELDSTKLAKDLSIHNSKIIINCLVEHHMVHESINLFTNCTESLYAIDINVLKKFVNFTRSLCHFTDQCPEEPNYFWIIVVNTEVQAVEEGHLILFNVTRVISDVINDLLSQLSLLMAMLFSKSISLFKSVCHFVMEVYFLPELQKVFFFYFIVQVFKDFIFQLDYFYLLFDLVYSAIIAEVIRFMKTFWKDMRIFFKTFKRKWMHRTISIKVILLINIKDIISVLSIITHVFVSIEFVKWVGALLAWLLLDPTIQDHLFISF